MAVGLLYNVSDLTALITAINAVLPNVSGQDRTALNRVLTTIGVPVNLPIAPVQYQQGDLDTRVIVLPSQSGTKQNVLDLINRAFIARTDLYFLNAIWKDLRTSAIDPWVP
jgi:hypothetical protein